MTPLEAEADLERVLDAEGSVVEGASVPDIDDDELRSIYREMRLARHYDGRAVSLQRQGRMGTYPPLAGQEAAQVGAAHALADTDPVLYQYRESAVPMVRGLDPADLLIYSMGFEEGNTALADVSVLPLNIGVGAHVPHAAGVAWAAKQRGDDEVACCFFGEGATSEGDFHEGMNFAGVFDLPAIFFCNNNGWAISVPRERQTASETFAVKADAYGFEGVRVDGMDPLAIYQATRRAREKALDPPEGARRPTLIEAIQYRFGAHTTADDPSAYRDEEEVEEWRKYDPIPRFESFLRDRGLLDDEAVSAIEDEVAETVSAAIERAEAMEADPDDVFDHTFEELPPALVEQREYLRSLREAHGDESLLESD